MSKLVRAFSCVMVMSALGACAHVGGASSGPLPPPTGIARFTRLPQFDKVSISPKGTYLAASTLRGGKRSLVFFDLATGKPVNTLSPGAEDMVGSFHWANDERVVAELVKQDGYLAAPRYYGELFAINANGGNAQRIFGYRAGGRKDQATRIKRAEAEYAAGFFLDRMPAADRYVLIEAVYSDDVGDRLATLYKLDAYNGTKMQVTRSPMPGASFVTDEVGLPRIALGFDEAVQLRSYYRDASDGGWRRLESLAGLGRDVSAIGFSAAKRSLYVADRDADGALVAAIDIDTGTRKILARNAYADPSAMVSDPRTNELLAVQFDPDLPVYEYTAPEHPLIKLLDGLLASFPGEQVRIVSATDDLSKVIAFVYSDRDPGRFYLVDRATGAAADLNIPMRPWIRPDEMAEVSGFHTRASDGLMIHGYLTLPRGVAEPKALPLVVLPHGGPHARDWWGFDSEAQLFASRGFAVLQVNFRGSTGYGRKYAEAGFGHWGDRVQQDIIDATRMFIAKGYVDGSRVCIFGASFGGYSAMQSAILAPDLFRCAVGYAGVYDLTLIGDTDDISNSRLAKAQVRTSLGGDEATLKAMSPAEHADKLRAKVMLVHGQRDDRAPLEHAELLGDALERQGRPVEWILERTEGHGFYDEGARERMYTKVLAFIEENTRPVAPKP